MADQTLFTEDCLDATFACTTAKPTHLLIC
ncbi:hypothetical protein M2282_000886 [Variovorax boronicumulans]|nr:hypothetical protein [Variovorax boronicumulans]